MLCSICGEDVLPVYETLHAARVRDVWSFLLLLAGVGGVVLVLIALSVILARL